MPETPAVDKASLRNQLRALRRGLEPTIRQAAAEAVAHRVSELPGWSADWRVAVYLAADGELATEALVRRCRAVGQQVFLPCIRDDGALEFARWQAETGLHSNRYGIGEPPRDAARFPASAMDVLFMPLVGWDRHGHRLGMGGGFYDRSLAIAPRPMLVGLAYELQEVEVLPTEPWDVNLDWVLTDRRLYRCRSE